MLLARSAKCAIYCASPSCEEELTPSIKVHGGFTGEDSFGVQIPPEMSTSHFMIVMDIIIGGFVDSGSFHTEEAKPE